jgi:HK97 gp10 family phage protein
MSLDMSEVAALGKSLKASGSDLRSGASKAVRQSTKRVESGAKQRAHVLSGELRDSIYSATKGTTGQIIATSAHAIFNEYGTSRMAPIPFMTPALEAEEADFVSRLDRAAAQSIAKAAGG